MGLRQFVVCACLSVWPLVAAAAQPAPLQGTGGIDRLINTIEHAMDAGDADALRALARPDVPPAQLAEFVQSLTIPRVLHSTLKQRDLTPLPSGRVRVLLETLTDRDAEGRV